MSVRISITASLCCSTLALLAFGCQEDTSRVTTTFASFGTLGDGDGDTSDSDASTGDGDGDPGDGDPGDGDPGDGDGDGDGGDGDGDGDGGPVCGDGLIEGDEACDDGNVVDTDACLSTCEIASCGDGFVWAGMEPCDDGNADDTDACLGSCQAASCGDGFVWANNEDCDDANNIDTDACIAGCSSASCGDGFVWEGVEECDEQSPSCQNCMSTCQGGQVTVNLNFADTIGWLSNGCCNEVNYRVANDINDILSASFNDPLPPGSVVTNVNVAAGIRHACNGEQNAFEFRLNGQFIGGWNVNNGPHCDCGNPNISAANYNGTAQYLTGNQNTIQVVHNSFGNCHEALGTVPNAALGTAFVVTITYTC